MRPRVAARRRRCHLSRQRRSGRRRRGSGHRSRYAGTRCPVDHRPGMLVLVTADRFPGYPVDTTQPVESAPGQHGVHGRRRNTQLPADLHRSEPPSPPHPHDSLTSSGGVLVGIDRGRLDRSAIPAGPSSRSRAGVGGRGESEDARATMDPMARMRFIGLSLLTAGASSPDTISFSSRRGFGCTSSHNSSTGRAGSCGASDSATAYSPATAATASRWRRLALIARRVCSFGPTCATSSARGISSA